MSAVMLLGGGVLLYFGAEWLVGGASGLARKLAIPELLIGLTVVAWGTSAPELVVSLSAAAGGTPAIALGNVVGSNIGNVGLILGVTVLFRPPRVEAGLWRRELPMLVLTSAAVPLALLDGVVSRLEGLTLLGVAVGYTVLMVRSARRGGARVRHL